MRLLTDPINSVPLRKVFKTFYTREIWVEIFEISLESCEKRFIVSRPFAQVPGITELVEPIRLKLMGR